MFKQLKISAPGKIILCGEHAVVYGKKALASAINLRTNLTATFSNSQEQFVLNLKDINQVIEIDKAVFLEIRQSCVPSEPSGLMDTIDYIINHPIYSSESKHFTAIRFLLIAFQGIEWNVLRHINFDITSQIPLGSGLGSSASFAVCLSAFFLILNKGVFIEGNLSKEFSAVELDMINEHAFCLEKIFHGKPSGIDNSVATFGNYILFEKGEINRLYSSVELPILIIDSGMTKNTIEQVLKVIKLYNNHKAVCTKILDAIENIVCDFVQVLLTKEGLDSLDELIAMNHGLLSALSVSNLELNKIVGVCQDNGFASKLTGSGGGGCCLVLQKGVVDNVQLFEKIIENKWRYFQARLGSDGVKIDNYH